MREFFSTTAPAKLSIFFLGFEDEVDESQRE